jgi:hypothetical protein
MLRWQWSGTVPRVDLAYDVVSSLMSIDGAVDASVETTFGSPILTQADGRPLSAVSEGTLEVGHERTESWFRIHVSNVPAGPGGNVVEVPGVVVVTYSVARKDGSLANAAVLPFHFRDAASYRPSPASVPEVFDAPIDGTARTVAVPLFAHCAPGTDCTIDFWFEFFEPRPADASPVIVSYRVEARVTAFDGHPLTAKTALTIDSTGAKQPPDVR